MIPLKIILTLNGRVYQPCFLQPDSCSMPQVGEVSQAMREAAGLSGSGGNSGGAGGGTGKPRRAVREAGANVGEGEGSSPPRMLLYSAHDSSLMTLMAGGAFRNDYANV